MKQFEFPVGYHQLHKTKIIDYQLNRWHSMGYERLEDMRQAGANIQTLDDWKDEMLRQAQQAMEEGRLLNGTFFYRAAEFFTAGDDPDKMIVYETFIDLFYNQLFPDEPLKRFWIPYENGYLTAIKVDRQTADHIGDLVIFGGFDSFIEEFYSMATFFAARGYDVYLFEGPGQGGTLRFSGIPLTYEWEKPMTTVLDFFDLDDVSILGISMGGWLCFRAAAFEPRIKRVIASSIAFDYMQIPPTFVAGFARWMLGHRRLTELLTNVKMRMMPQEKWGVDNLMYITKEPHPVDASDIMLQFNEANQRPDLVTQDVLILTGEEDHFIPMKLYHLQVAALKNARSVTACIFTRAEGGQNHCQVGNLGLALDTMFDWLDKVKDKQAIPVKELFQ